MKEITTIAASGPTLSVQKLQFFVLLNVSCFRQAAFCKSINHSNQRVAAS